jgi:anaerobic magnesium-protoporphyrin IX monomethyl ester cyclase
MRIVLINSPLQNYGKVKKNEYYTTPPLGLGYLATIAKNLNCNVKLIDAEALGLSPKEIIEQTIAYNPDAIGVNITAPTLELTKSFIKSIKQKTGAITLAGGPDATIRPEIVLKAIPTVDMVVRGEGERTLEELINNGFKPDAVKGVSFRRKEEIVHNSPRELITNLDSLPFIDRTFFVNDPYKEDEKLKSVITGSRGCPYSCTFCAAPATSGRNIRTRSISNVVNEMELLQQEYGIDSIHFIDNDFIYNKSRILSFASELEKRDLNINWRALARVDLVSKFGKGFLERMKQTGCYQLVFGVESGSQRILDSVKKGTTPEEAKEAVRLCKEVGIKTKAYYMFGFPTETVQEMEQTLNHAKELNTDIACFLLVKAYPGTEMYNQLAERYGENELQKYSHLQSEVTLPETGNFDKYHIRNTSSISILSNEKLVEMLRKAYKIYYSDGRRRTQNKLELVGV